MDKIDLVPKDERIIRSYDEEVNGSLTVRYRSRRRLVVAWCMLALVVCACLACRGREGRARALLRQAEEHVEQAEFGEASRLYRQILDEYPGTKVAEQAQQGILLYHGLSTAVDTYPVRRVRDQLILTGRAIYRYEDRRGRWPKSLEQLRPNYLSQDPIDPWGRGLVYVVKGSRRGYVLGCYGSDGRPGGEGEARDWFIENGRFVKKPSVALP